MLRAPLKQLLSSTTTSGFYSSSLGQRVRLSGWSTVNWVGKVLSKGAFTGAGVGACAGRVPNLTLTAAGVGAVSAVGTDQGLWSPSTFADGIGTDLLLWLRAEDDATPQAITGGGRQFYAADKEYMVCSGTKTNLNFGTGDATISLHLNWTTLTTGMAISHGYWGTGGWLINQNWYSGSNRISITLGDGTDTITVYGPANSAVTGKWTHVCVTLDRDGNATVYVNGVAGTPVSMSGIDTMSGNESLTFANLSPEVNPTYYGDVLLSQVGIFKGVSATSDQVQWLYNLGNGRLAGEVAAHATFGPKLTGTAGDFWNLNETSGTANAVSYSGANDLTPTFGELLSNTGFETAGGGGADVHADWAEYVEAGATLADEGTIVHGGAHALKLVSGPASEAAASQQLVVTIGHRYYYSLWARNGGSGDFEIRVGNPFAQSLTSSYVNYTGTVTAAGSGFVGAWSRSGANITVYVDDFSLKAVDIPPCNGPSTDIASDSSANGNHGTFNGDPTAWSTDVPHGSPNPTVFNTIDETTYPGVMLGFASPDTARSTDIAVGLTGTSLLFDGSDDYVLIGNIGNITSCDFYVKSVATNQELFTLANSTATAVTVVGGTLTFGASLSASAILVDGVSKTAGEAGALINDGTWHRVQFTLTSVAASDVRLGTDSSAYGNIYLDDVKLGAATHWGFDEADTRVLPVLGAGLSLNISYADTRCMTANAIAIGGGSCTISMWSKAVSGSYLDFNNGTQHTLGWLSNHTLRFSPNGGGANLDSSQFGQNGLWNHVCAVHTGTTSSIYMNGVLVAQGTTASLGAASGSLKLGEWSNIKEDDVRVYSEALTAAKILYLYTEGDVGTDPTATNLVGHWKLDDGAASEPVDGDPILEWRSHEGYQFQQLTASKRPLYETSAVNSKAGIRFDGTDDLLRLASSLFATTQGYLWIVCRLDAVPDSYQTFLASSDEAGTTKLFAIERGNTANAHVNIRQNDAGTELLWDGDTTLAINTDYCLKLNGVPTVTVDVNNDEQTMNADTGTPPSEIWPGVPSARDNVTLGALKHTSETRFLSGLICEVIAVKSTTAAGQIAKVDSYLTAQYGMTV